MEGIIFEWLEWNGTIKNDWFFAMWWGLVMEGIIFEWLEWNGTIKNDWFFAMWWGLVVVWFLYGTITLYQRLRK